MSEGDEMKVAEELERALLGDEAALEKLYAEDVEIVGALGSFRGRERLTAFLREALPAFGVTALRLHELWADASGERIALRHRVRWEHTGSAFGHAPTGRSGDLALTHALTVRDGRITQHVFGVCTFDLPQVLLADWGMAAAEVPDPSPELVGATPGDPSTDPADGTLGRRFARAYGARDLGVLEGLYDPGVKLFNPLGWGDPGWEGIRSIVEEFHNASPGMRVGLHDEFASADGTSVCLRLRVRFDNTQPFFGNPPVGDLGEMLETHLLRLRDGRIVRHIVGDGSFEIARAELVDWKLPFPTDTPDPDPEVVPVA